MRMTGEVSCSVLFHFMLPEQRCKCSKSKVESTTESVINMSVALEEERRETSLRGMESQVKNTQGNATVNLDENGQRELHITHHYAISYHLLQLTCIPCMV